MLKSRPHPVSPGKDPLLAGQERKKIPFEFVLDALADASPWTRPMFGCLAIYVGDKIVVVLREKPGPQPDNGVWLATTIEHHDSLRRDFPTMRSISVFGKEVTAWQVLPSSAADFEEAATRACEFVLAGDPRIGKIPKARKTPSAKPATKREASKSRNSGAPKS